MTSKLKCPVCPYCNNLLHCGAELNVDGHNVEMWYCTNYACEYSEDLIGTREMWEAFTNARHIFAQGQENTKELAIKLMQARQDLEIATKALEEIRYCKSAGFDLPAQNPWEIIADKALKTIGTHNE